MPNYTLGGKKLMLRPNDAVGKGGEADVFIEDGRAIKIYKPPNHPDLAGDAAAQAAAKDRINEHQRKLPAFPRGLPGHVIVPEALVLDVQGRIAGYAMKPLIGAEVLYRYGERSFREAGASDETAVAVLADLRQTVEGVHRANVVVGDFNDLNVLAKGREAFLIDADSMQFGPFYTHVFTTRFVDPLVCDPRAKALIMKEPHNRNSDWYAYAIMLMQCLLYVGPYGGVYAPKDPAKRLPHDLRPLRRVTVFDPEVKYPKPARHFRILPDDLLNHFEQTFVKDKRGAPDARLVENLRFTTCAKCGTTHARAVCPSCVHVTPPMQKEIHKGAISAFKEFSTAGVILHATLEHDTLRLVYHEAGKYLREGGNEFAQGTLDPHFRYRVSGEKTLMGRGNHAIVFDGDRRDQLVVDAYGLLPLFDANAKNTFFVRDGGLWRIGTLGAEYPDRFGDVLPGQTLFWCGDTHGFGLYRAGELTRYFVFGTGQPGINDSIKLPPIRGKLVDALCVFGEDRLWFFVSTANNGRTENHCYVLDYRGTLLAETQAEAGDGSWLGTLRGKCAAKGFLLSSTDDGVVRIESANGTVSVVKEFPATAEFVDAETKLLLGNRGLYAVQRGDVWRLVLK
ncbi:MAG: hypothetical protein ABA06_03775 [Parcubacteria bacterium C7867-001]|nr:MAG: hypothetical protein ABA06_03775 [Parcubacteria bacterium C7867-001]